MDCLLLTVDRSTMTSSYCIEQQANIGNGHAILRLRDIWRSGLPKTFCPASILYLIPCTSYINYAYAQHRQLHRNKWQTDLWQSQVDRHCLWNVQEPAVTWCCEDEAIERLWAKCAEQYHQLIPCIHHLYGWRNPTNQWDRWAIYARNYE